MRRRRMSVEVEVCEGGWGQCGVGRRTISDVLVIYLEFDGSDHGCDGRACTHGGR